MSMILLAAVGLVSTALAGEPPVCEDGQVLGCVDANVSLEERRDAACAVDPLLCEDWSTISLDTPEKKMAAVGAVLGVENAADIKALKRSDAAQNVELQRSYCAHYFSGSLNIPEKDQVWCNANRVRLGITGDGARPSGPPPSAVPELPPEGAPSATVAPAQPAPQTVMVVEEREEKKAPKKVFYVEAGAQAAWHHRAGHSVAAADVDNLPEGVEPGDSTPTVSSAHLDTGSVGVVGEVGLKGLGEKRDLHIGATYGWLPYPTVGAGYGAVQGGIVGGKSFGPFFQLGTGVLVNNEALPAPYAEATGGDYRKLRAGPTLTAAIVLHKTFEVDVTGAYLLDTQGHEDSAWNVGAGLRFRWDNTKKAKAE